MKLLLQPLPIRIFHWVMFFCVMILLSTGLYINNPFDLFRFPLRTIREIHSLFGLVLIANFLGQIYYYIFTTKWSEVLFLPWDIVNLRSFFRYVLFITDGHPNFGRYNPGQKALFSVWWLAVLIAAITSIPLLFPSETIFLQRILGGLQTIRILHYFVAVIFAASIPLHLYLVFTEDPAKLQAMFTGYINKEAKPSATEDKKLL
ncbi:cytochrome b/b6 domain-containing protein [Dendrosporobacter sp. 1207_IL3150]|uniref:cytochrome b/b6 domain-containing protein n=1 Tax=Dendrosporobacter sp. 1207_IL3150 TaxID=3084054 RepID=UPI002FDAC725